MLIRMINVNIKLVKYAGAAAFVIMQLGQTANASSENPKVSFSDGRSSITFEELREELSVLPVDVRLGMNRQQMTTFVDSLLVDLRLAEESKKSGIENRAEVKLGLRRAIREVLVKSLVNVKTAEIAGSLPDLNSLAMERYMVNTAAYTEPEAIHVSHILFSEEIDGVTPKQRADRALAKIKDGAEFAELAKIESDDKGTKSQGGELQGWSARGQFVQQFEDAAFALKPGEISAPVRTRYGYHIIKLLERREPRRRPFEEVKDDILKNLRQEVIAGRRTDWMNPFLGLRSVEIDDETFKRLIER